MNLQSAIRKARRSLRWALVDEQGATNDIEVISEVEHKRHIILFPAGGSDVRDSEYLHELAHAWLAENVNPLLSTATFALGTPDEYLPIIAPPKRAAADWFADAVLMEWAPDAERAEIEEHVEYILAFPLSEVIQDPSRLYGGALIMAQAALWLNRPTTSFPAIFQPVIADFLRVDPTKPSIGRMQFLINALLAHTTSLRVQCQVEDGLDVWQVIPGPE